MRRSTTKRLWLALALVLLSATLALATNGDNLIAIGPNARAMGGTGIAQPQDAISAVFANPAAMCFGTYCPSSEVNFAGTLFMPHVDAKISTGSGVVSADSEDQVYAIPAIGLSVPIGSGPSNWRFGLAAYGVTGLGVDYKGSDIDNTGFYDFGPGGRAPLVAGEYTQLQIMKFAPAVAFQPNTKLSLGMALHIDYATLDLRDGGSSNYGWGVQPGLIFKPFDQLSLGLTYTSPQSVDHDDVKDFDGDGSKDTLTLESPQQIGIGAAYELLGKKLLIEADVKWINWSDADGYKEFDWNDQWVFALGAQFQPVTGLFLRAGYNYGKNPVDDHDGWDGSFNPATGFPNSIQRVQGKTIPTYYYETFRIVGFPAVVEHHVTMGLGYQFTPSLLINLGYMHAFENSIEENGTDPFGRPVTIKSSLSEDSLDFGITWRF